MAKFKTVGMVAKKKAPKKGKYIKLTESITASKDKPVYLQLFDPKQKEGQSLEEFEQLKSWKLADVVMVLDE
jgi:hypothetical protein